MKLLVDLPLPAVLDQEHGKLLTDHWARVAQQRYRATETWRGNYLDGDDWVVVCTPPRVRHWKGLAPIIYTMPDGEEFIEPRLPLDVWALRVVSGETAGVCTGVVTKYGSLVDVPAKAKKWAPLARQAQVLAMSLIQHPELIDTQQQRSSTVTVTSAPEDYRLCTDLGALLRRCENAGTFAYDFEYGADDDGEGEEEKDPSLMPVGVSLSWEEGRAEYVPLGHEGYDQNFDPGFVLPLLQHATGAVLWNAKADMQVHMNHADSVDDVALHFFHSPPNDAMALSYMLSLEPLGLKARTWLDYGHRMQAISELIGKKPKQIPFSKVPVARAIPYGCQDADWTRRHWLDKREQIYERGWQIYEEIERPLTVILAHAQLKGIPFDRQLLEEMWVEDIHEMDNLQRAIFYMAGTEWNIASSEQTACVLYRKLGLPPQVPTKKSFAPSVASDALYPIAPHHTVIPLLLRWKKLNKLGSAFYAKLLAQPTDVIHCRMNQFVVDTGRLSSAEPNMQQNPPKVRRAIVAPEGYTLGAADESQLELRIMASLSQCGFMMSAYMSDPPRDLHEMTRIQTGLEDRRPAKIANFLTQYGGAAARFQVALAKNGVYWTLQQCQDFLDIFFAGRPEIREYWARMNTFCEEHGYAETLDGRRRYIPEIYSSKPDERGSGERKAGNMPVQGTGSDIVKRSMVMTWEPIVRQGGWMPLQVHDEIVTIQKPEHETMVRALLAHHMTTPNPIAPVPLKADIAFGHSWGEVH